jgi:hypothetical protein
MKTKIFFLTLLAIQSSYTFSADSANEQSRLLQANNSQTTSRFEDGNNDSIYFKRRYGAILIGSTTSGMVVGGITSVLQPVSCTAGIINATAPAAYFGKTILVTAVSMGCWTGIGLCAGVAGVVCYRLWNSKKIEQNIA